MTDTEAWQRVTDRYYTPDERARWAEKMQAVPVGFDQEAYQRQWSDLSDRIAAALPLDPASPVAQGFVAEWRALLAPFAAVADAEMWQGATKLYDRMDEWSGEVTPPFSMAVWDFIKAAGAAHRSS